MKKLIFLTIALVFATTSFSQKKAKAKKSVKSAITLANATNVIFEMNKKNGRTQLYLLLGSANDTLLIKSVPESLTILPLSCKLKPFISGGTALLNITWTETSSTGDVKTKLENATKINNEIWDTTSRTQAFSNTQIATNIKEIVYLDRLKNASETQEKNRKEGFEFMLQTNGDVTLINKAVTNIMTYNTVDKKYKIKKR